MTHKKLIAKAPGRINLIGEHIDYNNGYVLPAAINRSTTFHLSVNGTESTAKFWADNVDQFYEFDLKNFEPIKGNWENYIMGVVAELQALGGKLKGFNASFNGDVPIGSGLSSSASLEISLAYGLNQLFDLQLNQWQIIKACQMAEHKFVGVKCGIMDQFASYMGKPKHAMILDCDSLDFDYVPLDLGEYEIILLNSNVTHELASSEYNKRRAECQEGFAHLQKIFPQAKSFRDISSEQLVSAKETLDLKIYNRCAHVLTETNRVLQAVEHLKNKDLSKLGSLMYDSHWSLQNLYEVSVEELDFLVDQSKTEEDILGARMMGGGFGGCTINIIKKSESKRIVSKLEKSYAEKFEKELSVYSVEIAGGAHLSEEL